MHNSTKIGSVHYLAPTCFGIVSILRELTTRFHWNIQPSQWNIGV